MSDYDASLELVEEVTEWARVNTNSDGIDSFVKEALNLKAVLLYTTKQYDAAKTAISHFCEDLDTVTAHNDAIINFADDPSVGIQKLGVLLSQQSCPPETLGNLVTLYTRHGQDFLAAEVFEANKHIAGDLLRPDLYAYFEAISLSLTCPDYAIALLEAQRIQYMHILRVGKKRTSEKSKVVGTRPATASRPCTTATSERKELSMSSKGFDAILGKLYAYTLPSSEAILGKKRIFNCRESITRQCRLLQRSNRMAYEHGPRHVRAR